MTVFNMSVTIKKTSHSDKLSIQYGDSRILFDRLYRDSDNPKLLIKVHPDSSVQVLAPINTSNEDVLLAVKKRARWIHKKQTAFSDQGCYIMPRKYISGESHYYLGKQYLLKVIESPSEIEGVKLLRGKLDVYVKNKSPDRVSQLLNSWYKIRAKEVFLRRLKILIGKTLWVTELPSIRVLMMQTQWGSCSPNGRLTLNPYLVKAPVDCIDYVLLHELCHIAEHNHSERFYRLMDQVMPEWVGVKFRLDKMAGVIL